MGKKKNTTNIAARFLYQGCRILTYTPGLTNIDAKNANLWMKTYQSGDFPPGYLTLHQANHQNLGYGMIWSHLFLLQGGALIRSYES